MTENDTKTNDTELSIASLSTMYFDVKCPHCGRFERFEDQMDGYAWCVGHIQTEHNDKLPRYEGTGTEQ